jgi:His-Xaa-Ser system protein HxsD
MDTKKGIEADIVGSVLVITLKTTFYEKVAIFQSAYKFTDRCRVEIEPRDENSVVVTLSPIQGKCDDLEQLVTDFRNEVIDQQLRLDLEKRYGHLRDIIYEHAFSPILNLGERLKDVQ